MRLEDSLFCGWILIYYYHLKILYSILAHVIYILVYLYYVNDCMWDILLFSHEYSVNVELLWREEDTGEATST